MLGSGPDEPRPARPGEVGVLGEEAVPGVHQVGSGVLDRGEQGRLVQVGGRADAR